MASSLTKEQLKNELISHGVQPPPANARKEEFVKLYQQHVAPIASQKGDFSSDEETETAAEAAPAAAAEAAAVDAADAAVDVTALSDEDLYEQLVQHGIPVGPIVDSTRAVYQRKLAAVLGQPSGGGGGGDGDQAEPDATANGDRFSDSEDEPAEAEAPAVADAAAAAVPEAEAPAEVVASSAPEPLTAIRKRLGDSRPPSSLSAQPLVDKQGTPTPRPSIRSVTSSGTYPSSYESTRRLLDQVDGVETQDSASTTSSTAPRRRAAEWLQYALLAVFFVAVAYYAFTHADCVLECVQSALRSVRDGLQRLLPGAGTAEPAAAPAAGL